MGKTALNKMINRSAFPSHKADDFWPIPDQIVGLEIELEGQPSRDYSKHVNNGSPYWTTHQDNSLRNGIEYVLSEPLMGSELRKAISYFFSTFKTYSTGPRTSIHVHLNMRQDNESLEGLKNMVILYAAYEEAFFRIADFNRKWCAYCNPFEDNPPQILIDVLRADNTSNLHHSLEISAGRGTNRYYGLNLNALERFGTLEFRHFPLVHEEERLVDWVSLLMELKQAANTLADRDIHIADLIKEPDDVFKLREYLPRFWDLLNSYVTPAQAFIKLSNICGLALPIAQNASTVGENPAWRRFLDEQEKRGKKVDVTAKKKTAKVSIPNPYSDSLAATYAATLNTAPPYLARDFETVPPFTDTAVDGMTYPRWFQMNYRAVRTWTQRNLRNGWETYMRDVQRRADRRAAAEQMEERPDPDDLYHNWISQNAERLIGLSSAEIEREFRQYMNSVVTASAPTSLRWYNTPYALSEGEGRGAREDNAEPSYRDNSI